MRRTTLFFFTLILITAVFLRIWKLGEIPKSITNDEANGIYTSYLIWQTGHDVDGKFLPLAFELDNSISPVAIYLMTPIIGVFGPSPLSGRAIFSLLGIISVILIFLITKKMFNNNLIALSGMFVMAVSPWQLHFSRSSYESIVVSCFFLLGLYVFLRKEKLWLSGIFFTLSFYSYHATKIFLIPFLFLLLFLYRKEFLNKKKELLSFIFVITSGFLLFIFIIFTQEVTRQKVFLWNDITTAARLVNWERRVNSAPNFLKPIFSNKPLYFLRVMRENYLESFSMHYLFLYGDTSGLGGIYGTYYRGVLYIIELPLLILGLFFILTQKDKKLKYLIIGALLLAPLPSTFTFDKTFASRNIMLSPFFSIIIGCGIYYFFTQIKFHHRLIRLIFFGLFCVLYLFLISEYLYQYYYRYSIYGAESWFYSSREVVELVGKQKKNYKNIYVADAGLLLQYAVFNKSDPSIVRKLYRANPPLKIENIVFMATCIDTGKDLFSPQKYLPASTLYIVHADCHKETKPMKTFVQQGEPLRTIWKVYERK